MNTELFDIKIRAVEGGVTAAAGFKAAGITLGSARTPSVWITRVSCPINPVPVPACLPPIAFARRPCR